MSNHALDLSRYHFRHVRGDLTVTGTWFGERTTEPVLVITPTYAEGYDKVTPCVVPLRNAWLWSEEIGDPRHCARTTAAFAQALGMEHSVFAAMRILTLIRDHLGELATMPPDAREKQVQADIILTDQHGKERHAEVLGHV